MNVACNCRGPFCKTFAIRKPWPMQEPPSTSVQRSTKGRCAGPLWRVNWLKHVCRQFEMEWNQANESGINICSLKIFETCTCWVPVLQKNRFRRNCYWAIWKIRDRNCSAPNSHCSLPSGEAALDASSPSLLVCEEIVPWREVTVRSIYRNPEKSLRFVCGSATTWPISVKFGRLTNGNKAHLFAKFQVCAFCCGWGIVVQSFAHFNINSEILIFGSFDQVCLDLKFFGTSTTSVYVHSVT